MVGPVALGPGCGRGGSGNGFKRALLDDVMQIYGHANGGHESDAVMLADIG